MAHLDIGYQLLVGVQAELGQLMKLEQAPRLEGTQMMMLVGPNKAPAPVAP